MPLSIQVIGYFFATFEILDLISTRIPLPVYSLPFTLVIFLLWIQIFCYSFLLLINRFQREFLFPEEFTFYLLSSGSSKFLEKHFTALQIMLLRIQVFCSFFNYYLLLRHESLIDARIPFLSSLFLKVPVGKLYYFGDTPFMNSRFLGFLQIWNHDFYWNSIKPGGGGKPSGLLLELIERDFGSLDALLNEFKQAALTQFGSGWAWLGCQYSLLIVE